MHAYDERAHGERIYVTVDPQEKAAFRALGDWYSSQPPY